MTAGYYILGFYPVEVMHSQIYLTFGYVGVVHWATIDGRLQHWM